MLQGIFSTLAHTKKWWLRNSSSLAANSGTQAMHAKRRGLRAQQLEERIVPTIGFIPTFNGEALVSGYGSAFTNATVYVLFEGGPSSYWTTAQGKVDATTLTADIRTIINSDYLQGLSQYAQTTAVGVNTIQDTFGASYIDTKDALPTNFMNNNSFSNLNTLLSDAEITSGSGIAGPSSSVQNFYVFVTDPNIAAGTSATGLNTSFGNHNEIWVNTPLNTAKTAINVNLETQYFSEQLADTQAGNVQVEFGEEVSQWLNGSDADNVTAQIADGEPSMMNYTAAVDGVVVQAYWSQQDQEFIIANGSSQWTYPTAKIVSALPNIELMSNGVVFEKAVTGYWIQSIKGIQEIGEGAAGSTWANTIFALDDRSILYSATLGTGVFTLIDRNVTTFSFGEAGTVYSNDVFVLFNSEVGYNLYYSANPSNQLQLLDANIESFMFGPVGSIWANCIFDLHYGSASDFDDYTLYGAYDNLTFYKLDNHVAEMEIGAAGSTWANTFVDLHNDLDPNNPDTLWASGSATSLFSSHGTSLVKFESGVASFAFGLTTTNFANSFVIEFNNGTLVYDLGQGKLSTIDTGVTSFAFGQTGTSWSGVLYFTDGNGIWQATSATAKSSEILATTAGSIAFGLQGTGNWNDVYFLDNNAGTFQVLQYPGTSGPGTGLTSIYTSSGLDEYDLDYFGWDSVVNFLS